MWKLFLVFGFICLAQNVTGVVLVTRITPESGHIRPNKSTVIMCDSSDEIYACQFKIDNHDTLFFGRDTDRAPIVVTENGVALYTVRYAGDGSKHCGVVLSNVAEGHYRIGCQMRNSLGNTSQEFMTLFVNDGSPFKMKVNAKYQRTEPGSDVDILCSSTRQQKMDYCWFWLNSKGCVQFNKGHQSEETASYQYHGRGLDKGDCGVKLLNVTEAETGVVWCHAGVGDTRGARGVVIKVGNLKPTTEIIWNEKRVAKRNEVLEVECVMRGAYPLPPLECQYNSHGMLTQDLDNSPWNETFFRWPWEEQVKSYLVHVFVGKELGIRKLQCNAMQVQNAMSTPQEPRCQKLRNPGEKFIKVRPACGKRTNTHYNTAYKSTIAKRETKISYLSFSDSGELTSEDGEKISGTSGVQQTTTSQPREDEEEWEFSHVSLSDIAKLISEEVEKIPGTLKAQLTVTGVSRGGDAVKGGDNFETAWDEVAELLFDNGTRSIGPFTYTEIKDSSPSSVCPGETGALPGPSVLDIYNTESDAVLNDVDPKLEFVSFPWMAGVYKNIKGSYKQQCGGTLVTETHVISAAHCFWSERTLTPYPPDDYMIALGKIFRDWDRVDDMVQKRSVHQLHLHPSWRGRKRNFQFDITVIELSESVVYTPRVAPACLDWDDDEKILEGNSGVVTGWGFTYGGQLSEILRYNNLPYVDQDTCFNKLPVDLQGLLSTDKFCAGYTNRSTSVCPGDSGGGILFKDPHYEEHFLKGVVSLSFKPADFVGNCYVEEVTGFTMISQSMPWLKRVLNYERSSLP